MNWKKWIATNVRGTPMSLSWLPKCFPIPVANYGITKWGEDGKPTDHTKQMTFANLNVVESPPPDAKVTISWEYGMTVPNPNMPQAVQIAAGDISFAVSDVLAVRKMETQVSGVDPVSGEQMTKDVEVYAFYVAEGTGLLVIEIVDVKENLDGEPVRIEIAKS